MAPGPRADPQRQVPGSEVPEAFLRLQWSVPCDQGLRDHDVLLQQQDRDRTAEDAQGLLRPAQQVREQGPDQPSGRAGGGRAAGADGARARSEHDQPERLRPVQTFLLSIRKGVTTISSFGYINDGIAGKIILSQGWNGDVRRIVQGRKAQGDITPVIPTGTSEIWADNWCIPADAPHPVAAHAWIDWLLTPSTAVTEMNYHNYVIPMPEALAQVPATLRNDPLFNVPATYTDNYKYILNVARRSCRRGPRSTRSSRRRDGPGPTRTPTWRRRRREAARSSRATRPGSSLPSFLYYLIFFLGAMAILVAFSLATQIGFGQISYGFSTSQYRRSRLAVPRHLRAHDGDGVRWAPRSRSRWATPSPTGWRGTSRRTRCWRCSSPSSRSGRRS